MYCNEDGLSLGLELNIEVYPDGSSDDLIVGIVGPVVMLGPIMNDKVTDLTESMFLRTIEAIDWLQKDYKTNLL